VDDLSGQRKGTRVLLAWTAPTQTTDRQNIRHATTTRICRAFDEFPMTDCREVVKQLSASEMTSQITPGQNPKVSYEDVVSPQQMGPNRFVSYAVEVFNDRGRSAGLSNQVRLPLAPTLPAPLDLSAEVTPEGVVLHWTGTPRSALPPDTQKLEFRYRIYRRVTGQVNYSMVEEVPLDGPDYAVPDKSFEWGQTYEYKVASVTILPQGAGKTPVEVEGDDSPIVRVVVQDIFPPARPTGLQAVFSGVGQKPFIDLSWDPNSESDLQGYIVYRHEDDHPAVALNQEPVRAPSYRDENVQPGHTYTYSVQAVDVRGNASPRSVEASETVPEKF
jgi:hypothetical protein